jgi:hypothetical protein
VVMLISVVLVVYKTIGTDSDGLSEHEESFEVGIRTVYSVKLCRIGKFPVLFSLLFLLNCRGSMTLKHLRILSCSDSTKLTWSAVVLIAI